MFLRLLIYLPTYLSLSLSLNLHTFHLLPPPLPPTYVHPSTSLSLPPLFPSPRLIGSRVTLFSHYQVVVLSYIPWLCLRSHLGVAAVCQEFEHTSGRLHAYPSNFNWFLSDLLLNAFACAFVCLWGVVLVVDSVAVGSFFAFVFRYSVCCSGLWFLRLDADSSICVYHSVFCV